MDVVTSQAGREVDRLLGAICAAAVATPSPHLFYSLFALRLAQGPSRGELLVFPIHSQIASRLFDIV